MLDEYCAALSASVSDVYDGAVPVPDRTRLDAEMRDHGIYGLAIVSFSMLIVVNKKQRFDPVALADIDDEAFRSVASLCGDQSINLVADMVQHFFKIV